MSCPICDRTMQGLGFDEKQGVRFFWCPYCGVVKRQAPGADTWDVPLVVMWHAEKACRTRPTAADVALREFEGCLTTRPMPERQIFKVKISPEAYEKGFEDKEV